MHPESTKRDKNLLLASAMALRQQIQGKVRWGKQTNSTPPANPHYDATGVSRAKLQILIPFHLSEMRRPNRQHLPISPTPLNFHGAIAPHHSPLCTICSSCKLAGVEVRMGLVPWVMIRRDVNINGDGRNSAFTLLLWVQCSWKILSRESSNFLSFVHTFLTSEAGFLQTDHSQCA